MDRLWISSDCPNFMSVKVEIRYSYKLLQPNFRKKKHIYLYSLFVAKRYPCLFLEIWLTTAHKEKRVRTVHNFICKSIFYLRQTWASDISITRVLSNLNSTYEMTRFRPCFEHKIPEASKITASHEVHKTALYGQSGFHQAARAVIRHSIKILYFHQFLEPTRRKLQNPDELQ